MSVTEGVIPVGDTGLDLDTTVVEQTDGTVAHREAVTITDPGLLEGRAAVNLQALINHYGLVVRDPGQEDLLLCMGRVVEELKMIREHLNQITELEA